MSALSVEALCRGLLVALTGPGADDDRGVGLTLTRSVAGQVTSVLFASDEIGLRLQELHETLGVGPQAAATRNRGPVLTSDLLGSAVPRDWHSYPVEAARLGIRSQFVFPVQLGAVQLGMLSVHSSKPLTLSGEQLASVLSVLRSLAEALLAPSPDAEESQQLDSRHVVLHQAAGMVMVQLGCSIEDALAALRSRAYVEGVAPVQIARRIVARTERFEMSDNGDTPSGGSEHG